MSRTSKQTIAVVLVIAILVVAWWGSYTPMRKAEGFIATLQSLQTTPATSLQDLETRISAPLDYASPIGQEELVRNTANSILSFIQRSSDTTTTAMLMAYLNHYFDPIIARGKGMSFGQDIYLMGAINETAFVQTHDTQYLKAAQKYYELGVAVGPNRPQCLYGLFDVYRFEGNAASTTAIAQKLLSQWPTDKNIQSGLDDFSKQMQRTPGGIQ